MKIAIIGVLDPLVQDFLHSYADQDSRDHDFIMVDFIDPAPILEVADTEYPVIPYTQDLLDKEIDLAICFGDESRKQVVLALEDRGIRTIDLTGSFIEEPTVPLILFEQIARASDLIMAVPSLHLHVYGPIIKKLHHRFTIKRVAVTAFTPAEEVPRFYSDKMTEEEISLTNETIRLIDHNQVHLTASIYPQTNCQSYTYFMDIEFVRPYNMDAIREVLSSSPDVVLKEKFHKDTPIDSSILVHRVRRDFSADSAIHLCVSAQNPKHKIYENIQQIIESIQ